MRVFGARCRIVRDARIHGSLLGFRFLKKTPRPADPVGAHGYESGCVEKF